MPPLGPEAARIFRITHVRNLPWIFDHGLHCRNSTIVAPDFRPIGMAELIAKRTDHPVPKGPGTVLGEYVPFYFTPWSIMMYNIKTGYGGVIKQNNRDIAILVSSLHRLEEVGVPFVFTNGHAYTAETEYFTSKEDLDKIDWRLLRSKDFRRDAEDPGKLSRYQAEALAFRHVPIAAVTGIACYDVKVKAVIDQRLAERGLDIPAKVLRDWYF